MSKLKIKIKNQILKILNDRKPNILYYYLLISYLVSSVVNWLPFLDNNVIRFIKYVLFLIIFLYEINHFGIRYVSNFLSPRGLIVTLVAMIPSMFLSLDFTAIVDTLIPFLMIFMFNYKKEFYYKVLYQSSKIVAIICVFSIFSNYTGVFDLIPNGPWSSNFGQAGFGGYRTGYSNSLFLYIPILVFWHRVKKKNLLALDFFLILLIIHAQYISGGRAGIIASLVVLLIWLRVSVVYKLTLLIFILFASQLDLVQEQFRFQDLETTDDTSLDKISSGRVVLNTYYFNKFLEAPVFGYGFGKKPEMFTAIAPHIVWLRLLIDGGIFYFFLILWFFREVFVKVKNNITLTSEERKLFYSIFFTTFIIMFLEPNYLIGSVQGEIAYWVVISLLLKPTIFKVNNTSLDNTNNTLY